MGGVNHQKGWFTIAIPTLIIWGVSACYMALTPAGLGCAVDTACETRLSPGLLDLLRAVQLRIVSATSTRHSTLAMHGQSRQIITIGYIGSIGPRKIQRNSPHENKGCAWDMGFGCLFFGFRFLSSFINADVHDFPKDGWI